MSKDGTVVRQTEGTLISRKVLFIIAETLLRAGSKEEGEVCP